MAPTHDVFLSYSPADAQIVDDLALRLRERGVNVWYDEWEIHPRDSRRTIERKTEAALESCDALVLCVSRRALDSDWARLERQTYRFRDPLETHRRFIALRLDDTPPRDSLERFLYVDWRRRGERELERLVRACRATGLDHPVEHRATSLRAISLGHSEGVGAVAYHPDGGRALSASVDGTVRVWNLLNGNCLQVLEGHTGAINAVACHPDGVHIITGSEDQTVRVWNLDESTCLQIWDGHEHAVTSVACHPDGRTVISASKDNTARLWDFESGTCERILAGHTRGGVNAVAFEPSGMIALTGGGDGTIRLWELPSGGCAAVLSGHDAGVLSVACHPLGGQALSGSMDHTMRTWDLRDGRCERVFHGHSRHVWGIAYSPDGKGALSCSGDLKIRQWKLSDGTCERVLKGHSRSVWSVACHPDGKRAISGAHNGEICLWDLTAGRREHLTEGHGGKVLEVAYRNDGRGALTRSSNGTTRVWDLPNGLCETKLRTSEGIGIQWLERIAGHYIVPPRSDAFSMSAVAFHPDGRRFICGNSNGYLNLCDLASGVYEGTLKDRSRSHSRSAVWSIVCPSDGESLLSSSEDGRIRIWSLAEECSDGALQGSGSVARSLAPHPADRCALSGHEDGRVGVWDLEGRRCHRTLEGHSASVNAVAYDPRGTHALTGSGDRSIRLWDLEGGTCERILEGHTGPIYTLAYHPDGIHALSGSADGTVRVWDLERGLCRRVLAGHSASVVAVAYGGADGTILSTAANGVMRVWSPQADALEELDAAAEDQVSYTNAKVVLVGESQAGKSGLAMRLAHDRWELTESTVGAWASQVIVPTAAAPASDGGVEREIWLWDFGGQADQRLIHQLYLGDATLAIVVFDGQRDDALARLWDWHRALGASADGLSKLLVAGRTDSNPVRLSAAQLHELRTAGDYLAYLETSAKNDVGCSELRTAMLTSIDWQRVPWRTSPVVFRRIKDAILELKDCGRVLTSTKELRDWLPAQIGPFDEAELDAVIALLGSPGAVLRLGFGDYILLAPELLNAYAQCVIQSLRDDPYERGCISEERVLEGQLNYPPDFERLPEKEERIVLNAMHRQLVERSICLRDFDPRGQRPTMLVFPSYFRRERPDRPGWPQPFMSYRFSGYLDELYASLVVRLHHSGPFRNAELWRNSADLKMSGDHVLGVRLRPRAGARGELELYCDTDVPIEDRVLLARSVQDHLDTKATDVTRLRTYICPACATPVENRDAARRRMQDGRPDIPCSYCEHRIPLWDALEHALSSEATRAAVEALHERARVTLSNESRERVLVGEVVATVGRADQIARELPVGDNGIDMEIEFRADDGTASGRKLYLQLKSGDSHLRVRKRDGQRVYDIKNVRHADYWADQLCPVMLVIGDSAGNVEWMEIRERLRRQRARGSWPVRQIDFDGERFDVMSIRRWREQILR